MSGSKQGLEAGDLDGEPVLDDDGWILLAGDLSSTVIKTNRVGQTKSFTHILIKKILRFSSNVFHHLLHKCNKNKHVQLII